MPEAPAAAALISWTALQRGEEPADGARAALEGEAFPPDAATTDGGLLLVPEAACCLGCRPDPDTTVEVTLSMPWRPRPGRLRVEGVWRRVAGEGWRGRFEAARVLPLPSPVFGMGRRALLAAPLVCAAPRVARAQGSGAAQALVAAARPADLHSHAGRVILARRAVQRPFQPVAAPMREGGMTLIALAMVADTPTTQVVENRIEAFREPDPGELWQHGLAAFARLQALVAGEGLVVVTDRAGLARSRQAGAPPAVVVAAEGADMLEGRIERVEVLFREQRLRHLQLVHYRVNELGDIQTAAPVHGGLTGFGAEVVRACNRLGILVDVAHGTEPLVRRAAEVTTKPLVLSHTAIARRPSLRSRWVTADHARLVAATGGVVGVWPIVDRPPSVRAYAESIARMVDAIGIDHVGVGSDMRGLLSPASFEEYRLTPDLAEALLAVGFDPASAAKVLGGNYARVLGAVLPG
ncbi:peptidase M19 [Roseomonas sp. JC162]|uniref:Peptidase M19 n=1 Tax=Neoroseomonas marina TaxID=1232220 RepID=A0A848E8J7_9PROT|nr:membrane dipeptidase [Neoroseomonas marina]NMJ40406.1 peptidase M19 [Neoroseomonas marina]